MNEAVSSYVELVRHEMNKDTKINVIVDSTRHLVERVLKDNSKISLEKYDTDVGKLEVITKNEDDKKCFGGIILTNKAGDIIVKNTLDVRCDLTFQDSLPEIRRIMFPKSK